MIDIYIELWRAPVIKIIVICFLYVVYISSNSMHPNEHWKTYPQQKKRNVTNLSLDSLHLSRKIKSQVHPEQELHYLRKLSQNGHFTSPMWHLLLAEDQSSDKWVTFQFARGWRSNRIRRICFTPLGYFPWHRRPVRTGNCSNAISIHLSRFHNFHGS